MRSIIAFLAALLIHSGSNPMLLPREVDAETVRVVMQIGLGPRALAAAGVSAEEAASLLTRVDQDPSTRAAYVTAADNLSSARTALAAAIEAARSDPASQSLRQAATAAAASVASARQSLTQAASGLVSVAVAGLPDGAATRLAVCRQTRHHRVPPALWTASLSAAEWDRLELALIAERRAQRLNVAVPEDAAQLLAQCRAQPQVVQAQQNIDASLAAIESTFSPR